jgi:peptidoglycan/LPS O-acetylase OafA/YrhL
MTVKASSARFESLDSLRGICACVVALGHLLTTSPLTATPFLRNSYLFVDFFFVLSGFVICWNYESRLNTARELQEFAILRLGRLYPLHLTMLLLFVSLELLAFFQYPHLLSHPPFGPETTSTSIVSNLLLVQSMNLHSIGTWNDPSWSISTEFWAYAFFAVVMFTTGLRWSYLVAIPALFILVLSSPYGMKSTFDYAYPRCLLGFFIGVACCQVHKRVSAQLPTLAFTGLEAAAVFCLIFVVSSDQLALLAPLVIGATVVIFASDGGLISSALRAPPFAMLGRISYSIYMVHWFVATLFWISTNYTRRHFGINLWGSIKIDGTSTQAYGASPLQGWLFTGLFMGVTVLFSLGTYRFIEQPGRQWSRNFCAARRARSAASDAGAVMRTGWLR